MGGKGGELESCQCTGQHQISDAINRMRAQSSCVLQRQHLCRACFERGERGGFVCSVKHGGLWCGVVWCGGVRRGVVMQGWDFRLEGGDRLVS
jgi:hypothetical protein